MINKITNPIMEVLTGTDNIVVPQFISGIHNGRTLDTDGWTETVIPAGTVVITDGAGNYKPYPHDAAVAATYYTATDTIPDGKSVGDIKTEAIPAKYQASVSGWDICGVVYSTVDAKKPAVSIMTAGQVNKTAAPWVLSTIETALKTACPGINLVTDEEA
ncbi:MAG: hypothetical protein LIP02_03945 [Bacteroidales bacterium]|nr:hypothetical protein [Bacteroidales bacterium]